MKHLLLFALLITYGRSTSQTFDVAQIKYAGDDDKRINLVIMGDGYLASEFTDFESDATAFVTEMFSQPPFVQYTDYFNVYIIKVPSTESGATHPGTAPDEPNPAVPVTSVNNYFGSAYDSFNIHRLLYSSNSSLIATVLANNFPTYDQALILVNAPYYGGSGGTFPFASTDASSIEIAIHELGHSFAGLKDEYYPGDALAEEGINMTQDNNVATNRWRNWINTNGVGIYPYGPSGTPATWYRPHQLCKMQYLGYPFCNVCRQGIIEKIHSLVSPIDNYAPSDTSPMDPSLPLAVTLDLIFPVPNTLVTQWTLNGNAFSSNLESVSVAATDLELGTNTLVASVTDDTALLRVDGHETFHVYTVTWNIEMSSLGLEDLSSETAALTIRLYPNPVTDLVNVQIDGGSHSELDITITSLDGKTIQKVQTNGIVSTLDLGRLSSGLYVLQIAQNGTVLAQKKIVKE